MNKAIDILEYGIIQDIIAVRKSTCQGCQEKTLDSRFVLLYTIICGVRNACVWRGEADCDGKDCGAGAFI